MKIWQKKIKFSQFPEVKEINSDSIFPAVQDGENVKITYENLAKGLGISDEKIGQAVETYLAENPVQTGATQEQAEQIEKNTEDISKITESLTEKEASGTADSKVSEHNTSETSHSDIRLLIEGLTTRLNALADSDDTTLDQMSEVVAYIKSNKTLIEAITTNKVSVSDIVDNLTTSASNKPLSAKQGVALKALIDAIVVPKKTSQLTNDSGFLTEHQDISGLAPKATTLSGYGITDGATKEQFNQLSEEIDDLILVMTESELKELTQEELAEKYEKGTKILIVKENENLVRSAINPSGEIYNGCGYLSGYRLNSSGGFTESEHAAMTGFIPYTYGKEIHINGGLRIADVSGNYINTYNKNFELISCFYLNAAIVNSGGTSVFDDKNMRHDIIKTSGFTNSTYVNAFNSASYIRVSLNPCIGKDMRVSYI